MTNPFTNARVIGKNRDATQYHLDKCGVPRGNAGYIMSRSELMDFSACPRKWVCGGGDNDDTKSTKFGSLVDLLLFNPAGIQSLVIRPETYTGKESAAKGAPMIEKKWNSNATACKEWLADHEEENIVTRKELDEAEAALTRIRSDEDIAQMLAGADFQVEIRADHHDKFTGVTVPLKFLLDVVPHHPRFAWSLADLKCLRDGSHKERPGVIFNYGYHVQAALYTDAYNACRVDERIEHSDDCGWEHCAIAGGPGDCHGAVNFDSRNVWKIFGCENIKPFEPFKIELSADFLDLGRAKYLAALRLYCVCLASNVWPGYDHLEPEQFQGFGQCAPAAWMVQ